MLNSWYNKRKVRSASQELIKTVKYILKKHDSSLEPSLSIHANDKVSKLEEILANGSEKEINLQYFSLKSLIDKDLKPYTKSKLRQNVEAILIALALALLIRTFVVQPFKIPSGSMIPTLLVGDHLLVNKFVYGTKIPFLNKVVFPIEDIDRGDVVVFKFPNDAGPKKGVHYIKRVVGLPGDKIDLERRDIIINGKKDTARLSRIF